MSEPNHKDSGAPQGKPRTTLNTRQLKSIKDIGASATGYYLRSLRAEKVDVCHKDENGIYKKITVAEAEHLRSMLLMEMARLGVIGLTCPDMLLVMTVSQSVSLIAPLVPAALGKLLVVDPALTENSHAQVQVVSLICV